MSVHLYLVQWSLLQRLVFPPSAPVWYEDRHVSAQRLLDVAYFSFQQPYLFADIFYRHFVVSTDISVLSIRIGDSKYELLAIADANSVIGVVQWSIFEYIARAAAKILYPIQLMEYFNKQGFLV